MLNGPFFMASTAAGLHRARMALLLAGLAFAAAGCAPTTRAPVVDLSGGQPSATPSTPARTTGGTYVVKPRDTLYNIARATGVSVDSLVRWNNITDPSQLRVGQVLKLSGPSGSSSAPPVTQPPADSTLPQTPMEPDQPAATTPPAADPTPTPKPPETATPRAADANVIKWAWPASGELIQTFSAATKGIDIAGTPGDPVYAAADGQVMYSGNGVRGLGNLIIINHQSGFITAYAHNRTLLVKTGQEVKRGAKIAEIGQTDTTSPRLHFEVRRQGTPVNPLQYLPQR